MKKIFLPVLGSILLVTACKEKPPGIIIARPSTTDSSINPDTAYITTVPTVQQRNVLIEEFTGASCSNCPAGHDILTSLEGQYPGHINIVGMHIFNFSQSDPMAGAAYDFRTQDGTNIGAQIYGGVGSMPSAGIDRTTYNSQILIDKNSWPGAVAARISSPPSVNLNITSGYNSVDSVDTIRVIISYTQLMTTQQNLSVVVVEDSLKDIQEYPTSIDANYTFNDILRNYVTPVPYGSPVLPDSTQKVAGLINVRTFLYKVNGTNPVWDINHCRIISFITDANSEEVLQSAACKLTGQ